MKIEIEKTEDGFIVTYEAPQMVTVLGVFPPYEKKRIAPNFDSLIDRLAEITGTCSKVAQEDVSNAR